ncbi:NAD(P)-binding protein [Aspergillus campestris IBT 28561]|uniref:NAD(P)-binding protein n=1 Tax=Aspergillus campestris (strain IBT 28561) TaxID=1392248 RepID=A0A2I1CS24_ASPC2|nr:NAD(P)-binding protein [Aspergillus campestris IBT 28561]PKY00423.1 NAD(P)-binding protein [Aspergillus campestris IBT 28561]
MASYLITGASRGIGLAIVHILASKPSSEMSVVFAAARTESDELKQLIATAENRVRWVQLDIIDKESIERATAQVTEALDGKGLDVLINNAGIMPWTVGGIEAMNDLDSTFHINVTGVHLVTQSLLPLLKTGTLKKVVNVSTTVGSIGMAATYQLFTVPAYKIAKAALNMLTVQYAQSLIDQGFTFIAVSPGWVKTDLGGEGADLTAEQSANAVLDIIFHKSAADTGKFFNIRVAGWEDAEGLNRYDGAQVPW